MGGRYLPASDTRDPFQQRRRKRKRRLGKSPRRTDNARSSSRHFLDTNEQHDKLIHDALAPRLELVLPTGQLVSIKREAVNATNASTFLPASCYYPTFEQQPSDEDHSSNDISSDEDHGCNHASLSDIFDSVSKDSDLDISVGGATARDGTHELFDLTVGPVRESMACTHPSTDMESCSSCSSNEGTISSERQLSSSVSYSSTSVGDDESSVNPTADTDPGQDRHVSWSEWGSTVDPLLLYKYSDRNFCLLDKRVEQLCSLYEARCDIDQSTETGGSKKPQELTWSYKLSPPLDHHTAMNNRMDVSSFFEFDFLPDQLHAEVDALHKLQKMLGPFVDGLMVMQPVPSPATDHRTRVQRQGGSVRIDPEILREAEASLQKFTSFYSPSLRSWS